MKHLAFTLAFMLSLFSSAAAEPQTIRFGVLAELSGSNAANGEDCVRGVEIAKKGRPSPDENPWHLSVGPYRVEVLVGDHAGDAKTGVSEFKKLVDVNNVFAVIATRSQVAMPLNPLSAKAQVPLLGSVGHPDFVSANPYAFRFYPTVKVEGPFLSDLLLGHGIKRAAIISAEDEWTLALEREFTARFLSRGGTLNNALTVSLDVMDLSSVVSKLKAGEPEAIFINLTLAQAGIVIKKLREQGYRGRLISNFWGANPDTVAKAGAQNIEDMWFSEVNLTRPRFREEFARLSQTRPPTTVAYVCYAAFSALLRTLESTSPITDKRQFIEALNELRMVRLMDEEVPLVNRELQLEVVGRKMHDGKGEPID